MPPMIDPFVGDGYTLTDLTMGINKIPNMYGRLNELGLFTEQGVTTRTVMIEEYHGVLNLLHSQPVGAPGTQGKVGKRKLRPFAIPHFPHDDVILPGEVQGVREFGQTNAAMTAAGLMLQKLTNMRNKHAITLEWLRVGALRGVVLDSDASELANFFTDFGITEHEQDFKFSVATTEILTCCLDVKRWIETHLYGETMQYVYCLCSPGFYDKLTTHATVKQAFQYYQQQQNLSGDFRKGFRYGDIVFEEYIGRAYDENGTERLFIPTDQARFFPVGTQQVFRTYFAPADFNETVNTIGLPLYAKQKPRDFDRGWDVHTQSNPLPICTRPEVLVKGTVS